MIRIYFFILPLFLFFSCNGQTNPETNKPRRVVSYEENIAKIKSPEIFSRDSIVSVLKNKIQNKKPLVVHVFVPLCDNEHQGIVPVNASLGNGMNLATNLYWGAAYGVKSYFKNKTDWKILKSEMKVDTNVLERIIFSKDFPNGSKVILVADAYRGDRMKVCLEDYFNSLSGKRKEAVIINNQNIAIASASDLVIFNGHNGMMDTEITSLVDTDKIKKDAVAICCVSHGYFRDYFLNAGGYPLVTTTNFMAPEAYVLEAIVNSWAQMKSPQEIRSNAGAAYHKYQKCGLSGATKLFRTGW